MSTSIKDYVYLQLLGNIHHVLPVLHICFARGPGSVVNELFFMLGD
jgi:hypothetical protein